MILENPLINHEDEWIALTPDRKKVVVAGKTLEEVDKKLKKMRRKNIILHYVPPFGPISPSGLLG